MSWALRTASSVYTLDLAPDGLGPVLQDWSGADGPRPWHPEPLASFTTPADRVPSEYTVLGTRHTRAAELVLEDAEGVVGARVRWPAEQVAFDDDGVRSRFTARGTDHAGRFGITLVVEASTRHDVVSKHAVITNTGGGTLSLHRAFSPGWELPLAGPVEVGVLAGHWSREFTPLDVTLPAGEFSIGSRQGITSHDYSPVVSVRGGSDSPVFGIALAWSGSWRLRVDVPPFRERVRVAGGVEDESTTITLGPGESWTTPATLGVRAPDGRDGLRRRWHDYERNELARSMDEAHRPVVYNSWYATTFDVRPDHQRELAERAAAIGAEVFVVDDGWFAGRDDDAGGLGDWFPDPRTFPDGLDPLVSAVEALGLRFGLWVEPEAVSPRSALYRDHPEWVYRAGDRPLVTIRNQYVLDFGRPDVIAWTKEWLRSLLADSRITYLKWDMNRPVTDGGRPDDPRGRQWAVQHAEGYHEVMRMLADEFPDVTVEACSGGGGRITLAVLADSDVVWPSDETGPRDRLAIQHGFLSAYGPHVMSSWVTDEPDRLDTAPVSLEFRFLVAMAGVLGIGADLGAWSPAELTRAADLVGRYRELRHTLHAGRVEFHGHPSDPVYAVEYGTPERTVLLVFGRPGRPAAPVLRPGTLAHGAIYRLDGRELSADIAARGVPVGFLLADDADLLVLDRVR
ncbi:MAG: alpha-galactosidase [Propionicimonas sp.]|uniref:alpha-galactosidase n=1 Tax=Propionicimonas sp. TaxID=1955623 RepID=UPI003D1485C7